MQPRKGGGSGSFEDLLDTMPYDAAGDIPQFGLETMHLVTHYYVSVF